MKAGDTFLIDQPGTSLDSHLWIVISDPLVDPDDVVIVNLTSWRADKDQACVLDVGDHPYVSHKSCVAYFGAKWGQTGDRVCHGNIGLQWLRCTAFRGYGHSAATYPMGLLDSKTCPMEIAECLANQGLIEL